MDPGLRHCGRYEFKSELGSGAFGVVWRGWDPKFQRDVAVKVLTNLQGNAPLRFVREIEVTARLKHPNVVSILDFGQEEGRPYLVMEFVEGTPLDAAARGGTLPVNRAAELVMHVARGVQHAHEQGVLHRDIKPENILVDSEGDAKIVDFGLARIGAERSELTGSGTTLGTPYCMAPEQAGTDPERIGPCSDIYSLGATLYFALTGRPPLEAESAQQLWIKLFAKTPDPPSKFRSQVPAELNRICLRCLEKAPEDRYPSAGGLADDLAAFLGVAV